MLEESEAMDQAASPISRRVIITVTDDAARSYTAAQSGATARLLFESRTSVYAMVTKGARPSRKRQIVSAAAQGAIFGLGNPISIATQIATKMATEALMDAILKDRAFGHMIQKTGGIAMKIDGEDATEKLVLMLNHIRGRYVLGFAPAVAQPNAAAGAATPVSFHSLTLKLTPEALKRCPDVSIATAQGYYVQMPESNGQPDAVGNTTKDHDKKPD